MSWNLCSPTAATLNGANVLLFDECSGAAWSAGGYLHGDTAITNPTALDFDIYLGSNAATTAQQIGLAFGTGTDGVALSSVLASPQSNAWNHVHIDLTTPMNGMDFQDLMLMNSSGNPRFYVNNVVVSTTTQPAGGTPGGAVTVSIDATSNVRTISPQIYGVAAFDNVASTLSGLNSPINRWGGNATSLYNWQINADNRGLDWYFESVEDGPATPGKAVLDLVTANKSAQADSMITIGMTGWVAKLGPSRAKTACFSVAKYGAQADADWQWYPDAGNGVRATGGNITSNDPNDCAVPADVNFQRGFVQLLTQNHGTANAGGVRYYVMDNETALWNSTHRSVHPQPASMDEIYNAILGYGGMVKSVDPQAQVVGPEEWGWSNYLASARDAALNQFYNGPDRAAHGGMDYMPWLLKALSDRHAQTGQRVLDVFTLHYYPQSGEYSNDVSAAMQRNRNRSTRSLWDTTYTDTSWIGDKVNLIPRMKGWVNQYYPGTKIGITEYSWGADDHINGATAQADVLGIMGREGVDIANRWTAPAPTSVTYKAMQMYRNYDGNKSTFGNRSVHAAVPDPDTLSAFAALRTADGALTVMVINKESSVSHPVNLQLANFGSGSGTVQRWQLTRANTITRLGDLAYTGNAVADSAPAQSITLYVIR